MHRISSCPSCGREAHPDDSFCSHCGTRIQPRSANTAITRRFGLDQAEGPIERRVCSSCNSALQPGQLFCSMCGARHTEPAGQSRNFSLRKLADATRQRFEFLRELGRGGMGTVYLARELDLDRLVAIKVLASNWLTDDSMVERFRREARIIASLRHPSIVRVHGVGQVSDIYYFIMEFIDGVSLGGLLRSHGPLSIPAAQSVLYHAGSALSYAHSPSRGVIHRDIKPGNIMLDVEGNAFLTDFGISKVAETQGGLTMTGLIMGTAEFMSPEQCRGDTVTSASDQYALGAVLYTMLSGSPPFTGQAYQVLMGHTTERPTDIRELRPDCPKALAGTVMRMLAKLPGERFPDIKDALKAAGVGPVNADDPVRDELTDLVRQVNIRRAEPKATGLSDSGNVERLPTSLRIVAVPQSLETGDEIDLRATAAFSDGEVSDRHGVSWMSEDPSVAVVDPTTGRLVAVGVGSAVITAWSAGVAESVAVEVTAPRIAQLVIEPESLDLEVGETRQLKSEARDRRGSALGRQVLWSSSDPRTATVSDQGTVRALREGTVKLQAHCDGVGASAVATVVPAKVATLQLQNAPESLAVGSAKQLLAQARDARGQLIERGVSWASSDSRIARITATGEVHGLAPGTTQITALCEGCKAAADIKIVGVPVASIEVSALPTLLLPADTFQLEASPRDARKRELSDAVIWDVDEKAFVESLGKGKFRALAPGIATITIRAGEASVRLPVTVDEVRISALTIEQVPASIRVDDQVQLRAVLRDQRGAAANGTVQWASSDPWVARISNLGMLTGAAPGNATVTAVCGNLKQSVAVNITAPDWVTIVHKVEPPAQVASAQHSRRPLYLVLALVALVGAGTWGALSLGPDEQVPPQQPTPPPLPAVTNVLLTKASDGSAVAESMRLIAGDSTALRAAAVDAQGETVPGVSVQWRSADPTVATIDSGGMLIARTRGTVTLTALAAGISKELLLSVAARPVPPPVPDRKRDSTVTAPAANGVLQLVIQPWARVVIDGTERGNEADRLQLPLRPGEHRLQLEHPSMTPVDTLIRIRPGETTTLTFRLRPRS